MRLADCPGKPNCVSSRASDAARRMPPFSFQGTPEQALARLKHALAALPRTRIVAEKENYLHAESASRLLGFIDDLEFAVDAQAGVIHFRSASRRGYYDFGVNRARMNRLRKAFDRLGE